MNTLKSLRICFIIIFHKIIKFKFSFSRPISAIIWQPSSHFILLRFPLAWTWGISSRLLQQGAVTVPYLGWGVSPHGCPSFTHWKESYDQPRWHIKKQRHYIANKDLSSQGYGFSSGHVWMWELDYKESWALKNWWFWAMVLEKTLESPLDCKEIQPVHPKGDQSWVFIGRTEVEAETPMFWLPDVESWLIGKDPDAGRVWGQEEKGTTEDEMVGWHHRLNGYKFD